VFAVRLLLTDPRLAMSVYFGMTTPSQYRLVGPGAWSGARDVILSARERMMQPLNTRRPPRVVNTADTRTKDNRTAARRMMKLLPTLVAFAALMTACSFYRRHTN